MDALRVLPNLLISFVLMACVPIPIRRPVPSTDVWPKRWADPPGAAAAWLLEAPGEKPADGPRGGFGSVVFTPSEGKKQFTVKAFEPFSEDNNKIAPGAVGEPVEVHPIWLRRAPTLELQPDGKVIFRFETQTPMPGGRLELGKVVGDGRLPETMYRKYIELPAGTRHEVPFQIQDLLKKKHDVDNTLGSGRGVLAWRLRMLEAERGQSRSDDGRLAFRCTPTPCDPAAAKFVPRPTFVLGPFVDQVLGDRATISFDTDVPTRAGVLIRDAQAERARVMSPQVGTHHEITVTGLSPRTRYRYMVLAVDARGEVVEDQRGTFLSAPAGPTPFSFAVMSDSRAADGGGDYDYRRVNRTILRGLLAQSMQRGAELVVFSGDLIDGYTTVPYQYRRELAGWKQTVEPFARHLPIYEVMGNHEILMDAWSAGWRADRADPVENSQTLFAEAFVNPQNGPEPSDSDPPPYSENVYSFDYGSAHFAVFNSNYWWRDRFERQDHPAAGRGRREGWVTKAQLEWLDADLDAARQRGAQHLFVFSHEPAFPNGGHTKDAMYYRGEIPEVLERRNALWQILVRHGVLVAFFGDEHNYSRALIDASVHESFTTEVWQVVTGGAGAPYYAREDHVPWAHTVKSFRPEHHFVMVHIEGDTARLEAYSYWGERIDAATLSE